jgi:hypothetical protein
MRFRCLKIMQPKIVAPPTGLESYALWRECNYSKSCFALIRRSGAVIFTRGWRVGARNPRRTIRSTRTAVIAFPTGTLIKCRYNEQYVPLIGGFCRPMFWHSISLIVL